MATTTTHTHRHRRAVRLVQVLLTHSFQSSVLKDGGVGGVLPKRRVTIRSGLPSAPLSPRFRGVVRVRRRGDGRRMFAILPRTPTPAPTPTCRTHTHI